jgi:hypothetical protein
MFEGCNLITFIFMCRVTNIVKVMDMFGVEIKDEDKLNIVQ